MGGKQWWNISRYEISLEQRCVSALAKINKNNKVIKNNHMRKITRFMKRVAILGLSTLLRMWNFIYVGNSSVEEVICGA